MALGISMQHTTDPWTQRMLRLSLAGLAAAALPSWAQTESPTAITPALAPPKAAVSATATASSLELDALVNLVLEHNTELRNAIQGKVTAEAAVRSASAYANPRVEWNMGRNQARLPGITAGSVQGWGVSQLIENPQARSARQDAAKANALGNAYQIEQTRNAVVAQTLLRAYEHLLRKAEAAAGADAVQLLEAVRERVRLRVESGEAARYEIIKADAEIINARQKQQTAALQAEQALLALNRLAAGRLPARWGLAGSLEDERPLPSLEALQQQALETNPELRQLQTEVERARAQQNAARASRYPGMELRIGQSREPEVRQNMVGVNIQIPLLDDRSGPIAEADSELARAQTRLEGRKAELEQQLRQAWKSLEMARLQAEALSAGVLKEAESALKVAQAAYRFGERGILDVLDAQRVLRTVRADLLQARYQVQAARIELSLLAGTWGRAPLPSSNTTTHTVTP